MTKPYNDVNKKDIWNCSFQILLLIFFLMYFNFNYFNLEFRFEFPYHT